MTSTFLSAAPAVAPAAFHINGGQVLGSIGASGLALASGYVLLLGVRHNKRLKFLHHRDGAGIGGIVTGVIFVTAGGMWATVADGIGSVPGSALGPGGIGGGIGAGGVALALTIFTFFHDWKRMLWPALGGMALAVDAGTAGGLWGIPVNLVHFLLSRIGAGA